MGFKREILQDGGLMRNARVGDGMVVHADITLVTADANDTVSASKIAAGVVQYTAFSAGRNLTIDTGANLATAFPEMDVGDILWFMVSCVAGFAGTWVAATGVTLAGRATCPASSSQWVGLRKTGAATFTLYPL
jgi:hypothetical protein